MNTATEEPTRSDLARRVAEAAMNNGGDPVKAARNVARGIAGNAEAAQRWWRAIGKWAALTAYREMRRGWTNDLSESDDDSSDVPDNWGTSRFDGIDPLELPKAIGNTGEHKAIGAWTRDDVATHVSFLAEIHQTVAQKLENWLAVRREMTEDDTLQGIIDDLQPKLREFVEREAGM